ncbi:MAG: type II toxin-antitoxin system HipA family toxin [Spirochaetaceae bacterium]|nr:MAG: type II toxin-antitoxin system HipA family toxin [Spirochaetaceae bacterium]
MMTSRALLPTMSLAGRCRTSTSLSAGALRSEKPVAEQSRFSIWADWADLEHPYRLGEVILSRKRGHRSAGFSFDDRWLRRQDLRVIDPDVMPFRGPQYPKAGRRIFGFLTDSAPDRWGRLLMQRREVVRARDEDRHPGQLDDYDVLLGVHDRARVGALRFRTSDDGPFLAPDDPWATPPWTRLRELQRAARAVDRPRPGEDDSQWLETILAPGSSLGGARPKATVQDDNGHLWIAKFPSRRDMMDVSAWEYLVHQLAGEAGIDVPEARLEHLSEEGTTFLVRRFDRTVDRKRLHFASAMTLLGRTDNDGSPASYLDLAEAISRYGERPEKDLVELWSRIVFFMAVSNFDDHLRNHGFLLGRRGWQLSPVYDVNPDPTRRGLSLTVDTVDNRPAYDLALSVSEYFGLGKTAARERTREIVGIVSQWRVRARALGIPRSEIELMAAAFRTDW